MVLLARGSPHVFHQSEQEMIEEDFSNETSGIGEVGTGQKLPMPPATGRWNRSETNTILRVLYHRNDRAANQFLNANMTQSIVVLT